MERPISERARSRAVEPSRPRAVSEADEFAYRGSVERDPSLIQQAVATLPLEISKKNYGAILQTICSQDMARAA